MTKLKSLVLKKKKQKVVKKLAITLKKVTLKVKKLVSLQKS